MKLSRASALGVFATTHVAEHTDGVTVQGREIAQALGVPADYLLKILQQLVRARLLTSTRGPSGGFRLMGSPGDITLLAIVEAVDGPIDGRLSMAGEIRGKTRAKHGVERACTEVAVHARRLLERTTVRDLMDTGRSSRSLRRTRAS